MHDGVRAVNILNVIAVFKRNNRIVECIFDESALKFILRQSQYESTIGMGFSTIKKWTRPT